MVLIEVLRIDGRKFHYVCLGLKFVSISGNVIIHFFLEHTLVVMSFFS